MDKYGELTFKRYPPLSVMTEQDAKIYEKERKQSDEFLFKKYGTLSGIHKLNITIPIEATMDKKIKNAEHKIEKVEKKEFKGLLKEDHKLDAKRDRLETALHKQNKKSK